MENNLLNRNISQNTNNAINMNDLITLEEFTKVINWYEYSQNFKKVIQRHLKETTEVEYFFVDYNWINHFKKIFYYDKIKEKIESEKMKRNFIITEGKIKGLFNCFCGNRYVISENDRKKIKINPNNNIIQKKPTVFNKKYSFNNYYINFVLLDKNIFEELKKGYIFGEKVKFNLYIGSGIFIIRINKKDIEVGVFDTIYNYKYIYLLRFSDDEELVKEIEKIKNEGIENYISYYQIKNDNFIVENIKKDNGKDIIIINLTNYMKNPNKEIEHIINSKEQEEIMITHKKDFFFDEKNSQLNSIIYLLATIKELKKYLLEPQYKGLIESNKHIYILSFFFIRIYEKLYIKNKGDDEQDILKQLEIVINFLAQDEDIKPIENLLIFILNTLHEELNQSEKQKTESISLISYESPLNQENITLEQFKNYYIEYFQSIISNNINWIRKNIFFCPNPNCNNNYLCNFQSFPFLEFDLDTIHDYTIKVQTEFKRIFQQYSGNEAILNIKIDEYRNRKLKVPIDITDCFKYYLDNEIFSNINCNFCNSIYKNKYSFFKTPNYFFIILNRKPGINPIKIHLCEELNLETFLDNTNKHKKYKLIGLIINDKSNNIENYFYPIIKISNKWTKFKDRKISPINDEKLLFSSSDCEENSRVLLYKSLKY